MLCGLKTILTDMNILNSYRHIRPKKVKYPIPEIPDDSGKKSGTDWVLPKIIGSGRVSGTRQALSGGRWYAPKCVTPGVSAWSHRYSINISININKPGGTMQKSEVNKQTFRSRIGCRIGCQILDWMSNVGSDVGLVWSGEHDI